MHSESITMHSEGPCTQSACDALLRLVRGARHEQTKERVNAAQLGDRILIEGVVSRERPDRARTPITSLVRAIAHEGAERSHRARARDHALILEVSAREAGDRRRGVGLHLQLDAIRCN